MRHKHDYGYLATSHYNCRNNYDLGSKFVAAIAAADADLDSLYSKFSGSRKVPYLLKKSAENYMAKTAVGMTSAKQPIDKISQSVVVAKTHKLDGSGIKPNASSSKLHAIL